MQHVDRLTAMEMEPKLPRGKSKTRSGVSAILKGRKGVFLCRDLDPLLLYGTLTVFYDDRLLDPFLQLVQNKADRKEHHQ